MVQAVGETEELVGQRNEFQAVLDLAHVQNVKI